ncbi:hypothetical protein WJX72_004103 [[Myrmecia] bisecta]|uniref:Fe2OG dioxygenase domain-containing protein n=1 Tax=[Myrmecia] bisecta TaxID=41462 RepID=A0AAW1Q2G0_9CHLO
MTGKRQAPTDCLEPSSKLARVAIPAIERSKGLPDYDDIPPASFDIAKGIRQNHARAIKKGDLDLVYFKPFLASATAKALYQWCLTALPWYKVQYRTRGIDIDTPRFTTTFGIDQAFKPGSSLSVYERKPRPIPAPLQALLDQVSQATGADYNFLLINFYQDGTNSITYHSDDEKFLGPLPTIASLSLGGSRDFLMKHKEDPKRKEKFLLEAGDLIVMRGSTQAKWLHAVPKRTSTVQPRINITFRKALNIAGTNNYYKYNVGDGPVHKLVNGRMQPVAGT